VQNAVHVESTRFVWCKTGPANTLSIDLSRYYAAGISELAVTEIRIRKAICSSGK
jgi:hypothetical protein